MLMRLIVHTMLALAAVVTVGTLAYAEETIIEQRSFEAAHVDVAQPDQERVVVDVVPAPADQRVVERQDVDEERTVTYEPPIVEHRTDTVVTTVHDDDDDEGDDDDGSVGDDEAY